MARTSDERLIAMVREAAHPLHGSSRDVDAILDLVGSSPRVVIGGATLGTHEFQRFRNRLTRRLIEEKGFDSIAVDADAPDIEPLDDFVRGAPGSDPFR